jgi:putative hydrolase of the HAD superfamily
LDIKRFDAIIFDLDNTLYPEIKFLEIAYAHIGQLTHIRDPEVPAAQYASFLLDNFKEHGRKDLYQAFQERFMLKNFTLDDFLNGLRTVPLKPHSLSLYKEIEEYLRSCQKQKYFVLTNGNPIQQKNKVFSLCLNQFPFAEIVYCDELGLNCRKPSPVGLLKLAETHALAPSKILFVGDDSIDETAARAAKMQFMHVDTFIIKFKSQK